MGELVLGVRGRHGRLRIYLPPAGHSTSRLLISCFFAGSLLYSRVNAECGPETEGSRRTQRELKVAAQ